MSAWRDRRGFRGGDGRGGSRDESRGSEPADRDTRLNDLTGNDIVNNGPENEQSGLEGPAASPAADAASAVSPDEPLSATDDTTEDTAESDRDRGTGVFPGARLHSVSLDGSDGPDGSDGFDDDELALRRLMHSAVADLRPADDALDHLRKAVPARRARKRQAVVGMAAAALLLSTAVPAFVHVANSGTAADKQSVNAGHGQESHDDTDPDRRPDSPHDDPDRPSDKVSAVDEDEPGKKAKPEEHASNTSEGTKGGADKPGGGSVASSSLCVAGQLQVAAAEAGAPDASGTVYGTFRIANVSGTTCTVTDSGTVGTQASGAADGSRITVVRHAAGDPAPGLPDPSQEASTLTLAPSGAYEVRFAWVPSESCQPVGPSPGPTPTEGSSSGAGGGGTDPGANPGSGSDGSNVEPQLGYDTGGTADGSVSVSHVPQAGAPFAQTTIPNACVGTVYRTGAIAAS